MTEQQNSLKPGRVEEKVFFLLHSLTVNGGTFGDTIFSMETTDRILENWQKLVKIKNSYESQISWISFCGTQSKQ